MNPGGNVGVSFINAMGMLVDGNLGYRQSDFFFENHISAISILSRLIFW